ncbi:hypothetical protein C8R43DRAFT_900788, partial [Mycena crocata]
PTENIPSLPSSPSSDSSSDSSTYTPFLPSMSDYATVIAPTGKLPTLTAREVTPTIAAEFEYAVKCYFNAKLCDNAKKVSTILGCFQDVHVQDWLRPNEEQEHVAKLLLPAFMAEFRTCFLPDNWESTTHTQLMQCRMRNEETFEKYHTRIIAIHSLLIRTPSQLDATRLRHTIEGNMVADLQHCHNDDNAAKAIAADKLKDWITRMKVLDRARKAKKTSNDHRRNSGPPPTNSTSSSSSSNSTRNYCPALTAEERKLLNKHRGCTKCRRPYVSHQAKQCPNGHLSPNNYVALTEATCLTAKNNAAAPAAAAAAPIAATLANIVDDSDDSGTEEDLLLSRVSNLPPHRSEHLRWKYLVEGLGREFPLLIRALIDHGAHLGMINETLVETLKLPRYKLPEPEEVSLAMSPEGSVPSIKYVKLRVTTPDQAWSSSTVRFVFGKRLCAPLILGLPWLERNKIDIDHDLRTVIDKCCGYDLLHPPPTKEALKRKLKLREKLRATQMDHKQMVKELQIVCENRCREVEDKDLFENVKVIDPIAVIRDRIEVLAHWEELQERAAKIKKEYSCLFEPMPHVDQLPTDVLCEIKVKEADKTFKTRTYRANTRRPGKH